MSFRNINFQLSYEKLLFLFLFFSFIFLLFFACEDHNKSISKWTNRLIPLPKQIKITDSQFLSPENISLILSKNEDVIFTTIEELLQSIAKGSSGFEIRLILTSDQSASIPDHIRKSLQKLPNNDQAYAIEPIIKNENFIGFQFIANTPLGLLYATRTFLQLISPEKQPGDKLEIPRVSILDWPDIAERGEWGWNLPYDQHSIAKLKMNVIEFHSDLGFYEDGSPSAKLDMEILNAARKIGVKVVPIIRHMEQLKKTGLFERHPDVAATFEPGKPLPTDYQPGVCFSKTKTIELLSGWMRQLLEIEGITEINAWLSETEAGCFCPDCIEKNPFALETQGIVKAFELARTEFPDAHLRILLTQASFKHNEIVLANINPDTRITYYHGGNTYDSSHRPMIYPLLETFSTSGRWLGVYPQLTNSWRTIFPFTGPHFIQARMKEFADKGLSNFSGYATPANCYYEFNVAAAAEWGWNSTGRSPKQFAEAYANRMGYTNPKKFAEWADLIGSVGWNLAGSRVVESLIFNAGGTVFIDGIIQDGNIFSDLSSIKFGEGLFAEFESQEKFEKNIQMAAQALSLAEEAQISTMIHESQAALATLRMLEAIKQLSNSIQISDTTEQSSQTEIALLKIDEAAKIISQSIYRWGREVNPKPRKRFQSRFRDTVGFAQSTADVLRKIVSENELPDPFSAYREKPITEWKDEDFSSSSDVALWADVTEFIQDQGNFDITFRFIGGKSGVQTRAVTLLQGRSKQDAVPIAEDRWDFRIGRYCRYVDYWLTVPKNTFSTNTNGNRLFIKAEIIGPAMDLPAERRSCQGEVSVRKAWRGNHSN